MSMELSVSRVPELPFDGRWHRWAGRRLAIACADGGWCVQRVSLLRWALRWGGDVPQLVPLDHRRAG